MLATSVCVALLAAGCSGWIDRMQERKIREVSPGVAFEILRDNPNMLVLDLRTKEEFTGPLGHLAGALNVPLTELDALLAQIEGANRDALLVYCRADDECGEEGIIVLAEHGFDFPFLLAGGIEAWREAGFGTVGAEDPASIADEPAAIR